jgi:hypothetical protein
MTKARLEESEVVDQPLAETSRRQISAERWPIAQSLVRLTGIHWPWGFGVCFGSLHIKP